ncbi:MAG: stage III sporulation protein AE [Firmicutes bacterium]|nr:stage III sporulation protein AE [Bacillota bacterium]
MKKFFLLAIIILLSLFYSKIIFADDINNKILDQELNNYDFENINSVINSNSDQDIPKINFISLIKKIITGKFDFFSLIQISNQIFFRDLNNNLYQTKKLFLLIILSSLIQNLASAFKTSSVSQIAFYINYIIIINNLFFAFKNSFSITKTLLSNLINLINSALPLIINLIFMTGKISSSTIFNPIIFFISDIMLLFINFLLPAINFFFMLQIINNLTDKNLITNLALLTKNLISLSLKIIAFFFMSILSLQRLAAPLMENFFIKSTKFAVDLIPFVGETFTDAVDSIISWAYLIKNGVLISFIIAIIFFCMAPILNLTAFVLIYKIFSAVTQPICNKQILNCLESISSAHVLLLSCAFCAITIFIFAIIIFISI